MNLKFRVGHNTQRIYIVTHNYEILWYKEGQVERGNDNSITHVQTNSFSGVTYIIHREMDISSLFRVPKRKPVALVNQENGVAEQGGWM